MTTPDERQIRLQAHSTDKVERQSKTTDPHNIIEALSGEYPAAPLSREDTIASLSSNEAQEQPAVSKGSKSGWSPQAAAATIAGISASHGLAIGSTRQHMQQAIVVNDHPGDATSEGKLFQQAVDVARSELDSLYDEVKTRLGSDDARIFRVHAEMLSDAALIQQTIALIYQGHSAAWSWQQTISEHISHIQKLDDAVLAGRAVEVKKLL